MLTNVQSLVLVGDLLEMFTPKIRVSKSFPTFLPILERPTAIKRGVDTSWASLKRFNISTEEISSYFKRLVYVIL
jgi:hypothetical protein